MVTLEDLTAFLEILDKSSGYYYNLIFNFKIYAYNGVHFFKNFTDKQRPHKIPNKKPLALPRNTKCVCESLKKQNTKINIDFEKSNKNTMKKVKPVQISSDFLQEYKCKLNATNSENLTHNIFKKQTQN